MSNISCTTEPLDTIILVTVNLNVINHSAVTHTLQSQTIDLVVWTSDQTAFSNTHITDNTAVIVGNIAAVFFNEVTAFTLNVTPDFTVGETSASVALTILWCEALNNYATPFAHAIIVSVEAAKCNWAGC